MPYMLGFCRQNKDTCRPGEEIEAGTQRRPKWVAYYNAQVLLRLCSGTLPLISGMLTLSSGSNNSCSHPQTKTEPATGKIDPESRIRVPE
jgi:hypothetical protein